MICILREADHLLLKTFSRATPEFFHNISRASVCEKVEKQKRRVMEFEINDQNLIDYFVRLSVISLTSLWTFVSLVTSDSIFPKEWITVV